MQMGGIQRGRPAGRLTRRRRDVLAYVVERQDRREPVLIGPLVRVCGLVDRSSAKRIIRELCEWGFLADDPRK